MFVAGIRDAPLPADEAMRATHRAAWQEALARDETGLARRAAALDRANGRALIDGIFGGSPYLSGLMIRDPAFACELLEQGPDTVLPPALLAPRTAVEAASGDAVARALRRMKRQAALAIAVADVTGAWTLEQVTGALSDLAEAALDIALRHLLREAAALRRIELSDPDDPLRDSGLFVLGMGKLGARELNYSSDIDLIVLYDQDRVRTTRPDRLNQDMVRLTRSLIHLMEDQGAGGIVFRTDLRLRPDPSSTPLAISARGAEVYYESMGQNWERAAMIKARTVAGDMAAGAAFLHHLRPFVWRRSLDFEAIRDIHSIKRQINAFRGGATIAVAEHNLKLGRGGIREIEFFAQTQQLIWGGRDPGLRKRATGPALDALVAAGHVEPAVRDELWDSYRFLRRLEHRLQMVADHQTHSLPPEDGLPAIAHFFGHADTAAFETAVRGHLERVEAHYARLFEGEAPLGGGGSLVFTGTEDDPDTIATLAGMGFREPSRIAARIRDWHRGHVRPTRSVRAREILTELMPALLGAFAKTTDPDRALYKFESFLAALPSGVQLFSLFQSRPDLLDLVAEILGSTPHLADHLTHHPIVLDAVLTSDFFGPLPAFETLAAGLGAALQQASDFQDVLAIARFWANDRKFQVGVQLLRGTVDPLDAARTLSDIADAVIGAIQPAVEREFAQAHGTFPGGGMAVLALGKLGSRELTFASDLDLILCYETGGAEASDGPRPLPAATYFIRLTQRLLTAITSLTREGKLFDVDLRLRPFGTDGPLAIHADGFETYERQSAWTWEHMALTRARVVAGPPDLRLRLERICRDVLTAPRDPDALVADVASMRERVAQAHRNSPGWSIKHRRGGLVDAEFIAQYLVLRHAHDAPGIVTGNPIEAFARLTRAGLLDAAAGDELIAAVGFWQRLQMMRRLVGTYSFEGDAAPFAKALLARSAGCAEFEALEAKMDEVAARTLAHFETMIAQPAGRLDAAAGEKP